MMLLVAPAQFIILQRSFVNMLTNKCTNIETIPIPGNELMKDGCINVERKFMSCLIAVNCTFQNKNLTWFCQEECDQNQVLLPLLMEDEATYS